MSPASIWTLALICYCSPVQGGMAGTSTSVYEFDSVVRGQHIYKSVWTLLTDWYSKTHKCIPVREDNERIKYAINVDCSNIRKGDANIKRDIENKLMFGTILRFIKFNNFGTRHLNGPRHLFLSFSCTTRRIFEPLYVFEPSFNTDKYGNCMQRVWL